MLDSVFRALILIGFSILIVLQIRQIKAINIFHRLPKSLALPLLLIILVFGGMAYTLGETLYDTLFFLIPALAIMFSLFNKGLAEKTVFPPTTGVAFSNLLSVSIPFNETKDWIVIEQKRRLKVRFTSTYKSKLPTVYYIYFDKDQLEELKEHLLKHRLSLDIQS